MGGNKIRTILIINVIAVLLISCQTNGMEKTNKDYAITNIDIFKDTPVWELAKAVNRQRTNKIEKIAKEDPELLNYQATKYGASLLLWAVGMEKYESAEALLESGANPNITSKQYKTYDEETPLSLAAGFSWVDNSAKEDPKYVRLLLRYGADPNWTYSGRENGTVKGRSILMESIGAGIEKTKALVEAGADINHKNENGRTAAITALSMGGLNVTIERREYAHYLIVEKKANVTDPYSSRFSSVEPNKKFYPVELLRNWICDLESKDYKLKMEIVDEFSRQGVDYWETDIPNSILDDIKQRYPDNWEEYIKKY